jgi:hypothetical protein
MRRHSKKSALTALYSDILAGVMFVAICNTPAPLVVTTALRVSLIRNTLPGLYTDREIAFKAKADPMGRIEGPVQLSLPPSSDFASAPRKREAKPEDDVGKFKGLYKAKTPFPSSRMAALELKEIDDIMSDIFESRVYN